MMVEKVDILLVDDRPENLFALESLLASPELNIIKAESGNEALGLMLEYDFALVLLDVQMPGMDGFETAELMRGMEKTRTVPIIFVTAISMEKHHVFKGYKAGAVDYLFKPIEPEFLRAKVKVFCELYRQQRQLNNLIDELRSTKDKLTRMAKHDPLTGLANRSLFHDFLGGAMARASRDQRTMALLILDLDHFKDINDSMGHDIGDLLLKSVGERIRECTRQGDLVARLGGDEFAVVLSGCETEEADRVAIKLLHILAAPHSIAGKKLYINASIGIAIYPSCGENVTDLCKAADSAMYHAKQKGRNNYQFFVEEMQRRAMERIRMERELRKALEKEEFRVWYQPQINADDGTIIGVEALLRWRNHLLGTVSPGHFILVAEKIGLVESIGSWVLHTACTQIQQWRQKGYLTADARLAVNVSFWQLKNTIHFWKSVEDTMYETEFNPQTLEIELTEQTMMDDLKNISYSLEKLRGSGVRVAIDDFGTGYSSLRYLITLPIDTLKIDLSFIANIGKDSGSEAIIRTIIALGRNLDLQVVAEGVETEEQAIFLRNQKCSILQGNYFCPPLPADEVIQFLRKNR
jgi:diguanylate cyclase (GGDEF)-like protein